MKLSTWWTKSMIPSSPCSAHAHSSISGRSTRDIILYRSHPIAVLRSRSVFGRLWLRLQVYSIIGRSNFFQILFTPQKKHLSLVILFSLDLSNIAKEDNKIFVSGLLRAVLWSWSNLDRLRFRLPAPDNKFL